MKITLARHGGFAATVRRPPQTIETQSAELARLVDAAAQSTSAAKTERPGRVRDAMSYTITVEEDGKPPVVMTQSDGNLTSEFAALLAWLQRNKAS